MRHYVVAFGDTTRVAVVAEDDKSARQEMIQAALERWGGRRDDWEYLAEHAEVQELGKHPVWLA